MRTARALRRIIRQLDDIKHLLEHPPVEITNVTNHEIIHEPLGPRDVLKGVEFSDAEKRVLAAEDVEAKRK